MRLTIILVIALLSLASKCKEEPEGLTRVDYDQTFTLAPGESVALNGNDNLGFRFDAITAESRCPKGVTCVRAGEVKFRVTMADGTGKEIEHPASARKSTTFSIGDGTLVEVRSVDPYPTSEGGRIPNEDYRLVAVFKK
ncbi:MAG: hypothetical protein AAF741_16295 [Bacteroidota bacterium]